MKRWIHAKTDCFDFRDSSDPDGMLLKDIFEPYGLVVKYYPGTDTFVIAFPESPWPYSGCRELPRRVVAELDDNKISSIVSSANRARDRYQYANRYITKDLEDYLEELKKDQFAWANAEQVNKNNNSTVTITLGPDREFAKRISGEDPGPISISAYPQRIKKAVDARLNEIVDDIESLGFDFIRRTNDNLGRSFYLKFQPK